MKKRLIKGLFRNRDKPTDRTAGSSYSFFLGGTSSGKYVTERSAMQMTVVRRKRWNIRFIFCSMMSTEGSITNYRFGSDCRQWEFRR